MRGKGRPGRLRVWLARITPACAGKSCILAVSAFWLWDHPRVCGEKSFEITAFIFCPGSPPRVRGKVEVFKKELAMRRITPACAGKRVSGNRRSTKSRDHPRVCGEKTRSEFSADKQQGSPPRVRGKVPAIYPIPPDTRITPACAGKSFRHFPRTVCVQDHPRVCGEKTHVLSSFLTCSGSPPRVRGKEELIAVDKLNDGITPACAGKSFGAAAKSIDSRDHPRVCGEKLYVDTLGFLKVGSPPRVRGKADEV